MFRLIFICWLHAILFGLENVFHSVVYVARMYNVQCIMYSFHCARVMWFVCLAC